MPQIEAGTGNDDRAHDAAHQQQTDAGPTAGECGIKSSQNAPDRLLRRGVVEANPPAGRQM